MGRGKPCMPSRPLKNHVFHAALYNRIYKFTNYFFLQNLQYEQSSRIKELEKEISIMRGKHSDGIMQLKSRFLKEKRDYLHDAASKVVTMAKEANQVQSHISLKLHKV